MQLSLVAFLLLLFSCYSSSVSAQVSTTPSQSTPDLLDPSAQNWSGTYNTGWWGGVTGGLVNDYLVILDLFGAMEII